MEILFAKYRPISNATVNRPFRKRPEPLSDALNERTYINKPLKNAEAFLNKLNNHGYTQIGDILTLNDGTQLHVNDVPRLDIGALHTVSAKDNIMDFGSNCYFKYTSSSGKSLAVFSMEGGALTRPMSEYLTGGTPQFDLETERYIGFWNGLKSGKALMLAPNNNLSPQYGYSIKDMCSYLDGAGISKGFFAVKMGSRKSEFFYSDCQYYPLYTKEDYDLRYYTMTSSDFSYEKSVFSYLEPGTEITIAGDKYTLKDDFTLDIPYGTDIFDIHLPKYTPVSKVPSHIDCKA